MDAGTLISDWNKLGALVKDARRDRGWSQARLADRAHVSRAWIAKIESGHRGAELEQILRLFAALNLTMIVQPVGVAPGEPISATEQAREGSDTAQTVEDARLEAGRRRRDAWAHARELSTQQGAQ